MTFRPQCLYYDQALLHRGALLFFSVMVRLTLDIINVFTLERERV